MLARLRGGGLRGSIHVGGRLFGTACGIVCHRGFFLRSGVVHRRGLLHDSGVVLGFVLRRSQNLLHLFHLLADSLGGRRLLRQGGERLAAAIEILGERLQTFRGPGRVEPLLDVFECLFEPLSLLRHGRLRGRVGHAVELGGVALEGLVAGERILERLRFGRELCQLLLLGLWHERTLRCLIGGLRDGLGHLLGLAAPLLEGCIDGGKIVLPRLLERPGGFVRNLLRCGRLLLRCRSEFRIGLGLVVGRNAFLLLLLGLLLRLLLRLLCRVDGSQRLFAHRLHHGRALLVEHGGLLFGCPRGLLCLTAGLFERRHLRAGQRHLRRQHDRDLKHLRLGLLSLGVADDEAPGG